jgi:hypothetical protein
MADTGRDAKNDVVHRRGEPLSKEDLLRRGDELIEALAADNDVPVELQLAASGVWRAVNNAGYAQLLTSLTGGHVHSNPVRRSETGWQIGFIGEGQSSAGCQDLLGVAFLRNRQPELGFDQAETILMGQPVQIPATEAFVWVEPKYRKQGIATSAAGLILAEGVAHNPFPVNPANLAAAGLMQKIEPAIAQVH